MPKSHAPSERTHAQARLKGRQGDGSGGRMPKSRTPSERTPAQALLKGAPKRWKRRAKLFFQVQRVVHALLFGEQVAAIVLIGGDFHGHILDNFEPVSL